MSFRVDHHRWPAIDIFRGLAITCMLIVNALPDFSEAYPFLLHSPWTGITFADLAFPGFVFAMGLAGSLWLPKHTRDGRKTKAGIILRRGLLLFLLGCGLNQLPLLLQHIFYPEAGSASLWEEIYHHGRLFGILQRLGLVYICGMLIVWWLERERPAGMFALLLLAVSSLGFHLFDAARPFHPEHNISMFVDGIFPGKSHCYLQGDFDPEGLYGTMASTSSFLWGFWAGRCLTRSDASGFSREVRLALGGAGLLLLGWLWSFQDIICKALWTAPYVLLSSGGFSLLLSLLQMFLCRWPKFAGILFAPCRIMGTNALLLYLLPEMSLMMLWTLKSSSGQLLYPWLWETSLKGMVSIPFSILLFTLLWLCLWLLAANCLHRHRIYFKV